MSSGHNCVDLKEDYEDFVVEGCYYKCPLFSTNGNEMRCGHPHWKDKGAYADMIITQSNSRDGNIPEECPLRKNKLKRTYIMPIRVIEKSKT